MYLRPRMLDNGTIVFPSGGGVIPESIPGYTRDPGNCAVFHPEFPPCEMREHTKKTGKCGATYYIWSCLKESAPTTFYYCCRCKGVRAGTLEDVTKLIGELER